MRIFSKSKILAYRQCEKRLWLEVHRPELRDDSGSEAAFRIGHQVGEIAQRIYDTDGNAVLIDVEELGFADAFAQSKQLLEQGDAVVFEAGMKAAGALAFADVMVPARSGGQLTWQMIEVKSSTSVKDYHRDDVVVQNFVAESAGLDVTGIFLAHIDNQFVYQGDGDYQGLLHKEDLTEEAKSRRDEAEGWIAGAQATAALDKEPDIKTGAHCSQPYDCAFCDYCNQGKDVAEFPLTALPNIRAAKREQMEAQGINDLRDAPDELLTEVQQRVKRQSQLGVVYFDAEGAAADLARHQMPVRFLDFETVVLPVPIWKGTRPYQQLPFQFSLHHIGDNGELGHESFLDLSGADPAEGMARALIEYCGSNGPIFAYNASFEKRIMRELIERFPDYAAGLESIVERVVDLLPIAKTRYYHPSQHGSWRLKSVLPAICPDLSYADLGEVQDGGMAIEAFKEAVALDTSAARKAEIERQLLDYCELDTLALVRIWEVFSGRESLL